MPRRHLHHPQMSAVGFSASHLDSMRRTRVSFRVREIDGSSDISGEAFGPDGGGCDVAGPVGGLPREVPGERGLHAGAALSADDGAATRGT